MEYIDLYQLANKMSSGLQLIINVFSFLVQELYNIHSRIKLDLFFSSVTELLILDTNALYPRHSPNFDESNHVSLNTSFPEIKFPSALGSFERK